MSTVESDPTQDPTTQQQAPDPSLSDPDPAPRTPLEEIAKRTAEAGAGLPSCGRSAGLRLSWRRPRQREGRRRHGRYHRDRRPDLPRLAGTRSGDEAPQGQSPEHGSDEPAPVKRPRIAPDERLASPGEYAPGRSDRVYARPSGSEGRLAVVEDSRARRGQSARRQRPRRCDSGRRHEPSRPGRRGPGDRHRHQLEARIS